ncbi:MAG: 4a-hydroxytetrahydrobiopterin dehydratase [Verrucomicrobiaceae bacterium]|nr:4a-hydroxytetrahydrobiopterin dehydratase [Verrucomicrobiaceae bacterium]
MKREKLTEPQIDVEMDSLSVFGGWRLENGLLVKEFRFASYLDGVRFATRVAEAAESMDHHPDLTISWRRVNFHVTTHSAQGLTELDFELARRAEDQSAR